MAFRGGRGGGGRGRGGRNQGLEYRHSVDKPWEFFPERELPARPATPQQDVTLMRKKFHLLNYWNHSPYYITDEDPKSAMPAADGLQRYSDVINAKNKETKREKFESYLKLAASNFPSELIQGTKQKNTNVKLRWDRNIDHKMNLFEKLELSEKKKGENGDDSEEEEAENQPEEELEESSEDGDYLQNIDFDDDDDDQVIEDEEMENVYED